MSEDPTRALVLGGGGVTGIAWELGVLCALAEGGIDLGLADLVVGTSAGASVGAQITSGAPMADLVAAQRIPAGQTKEVAATLDPVLLEEVFGVLFDPSLDPVESRAKVGAMAKAAETISVDARRAIIESRLPNHEWPASRLVLTAIDTDSGELVTFDSSSDASLIDAVAASCAVPCIWPPTPIGGRWYMDGGVRSATNAELAADHDIVLILSPMAAAMTPQLDATEVAFLEAGGSTVVVLRVDDDAMAAMGPNALDPAMRAPALDAGRRQGEAAAADIAELWAVPGR
jgi:NTE family protein